MSETASISELESSPRPSDSKLVEFTRSIDNPQNLLSTGTILQLKYAEAFKASEDDKRLIELKYVPDSLDSLGVQLESRNADQKYTISEQKELKYFFFKVSTGLEEVQDKKQYKTEEETVSAAISLLAKNPELADHATELIRKLFENDYDLAHKLELVRDALPLPHAINALKIVENNTSAASYAPLLIDYVGKAYERELKGKQFNIRENQHILSATNSFLLRMGSILEKHPGSYEKYKSHVFNFIARNPELSSQFTVVLEKIGLPGDLLQIDAKNIDPKDLLNSIKNNDFLPLIKSISSLRTISDLFSSLNPDINRDLFEKLLPKVFKGDVKKTELLRIITSNVESRYLGTDMENAGIKIEELPQLLDDETILGIVDVMLDDPKSYRFELAQILSQIPIEKIPESMVAKLNPIAIDLELEIRPSQDGLYICSTGEPRMAEAMSKNAVVIVNGEIMVKMIGKMTGVLLDNVTTKDGVVLPKGMFYSPIDGKTRMAIKEAFDQGKSRVDLDRGQWAIMRPISETSVDTDLFLENAKIYAQSLPDTLPATIDGLPREQFRLSRKEDQNLRAA
jgi:hypothetical protein